MWNSSVLTDKSTLKFWETDDGFGFSTLENLSQLSMVQRSWNFDQVTDGQTFDTIIPFMRMNGISKTNFLLGPMRHKVGICRT